MSGQDDRARLLASLSVVSHVLIFDQDTPHELLGRIRPDRLVKGGTYTRAEVVGAELVQSYGGRVCVTGRTENASTSGIIAAIRQTHVQVTQVDGCSAQSAGKDTVEQDVWSKNSAECEVRSRSSFCVRAAAGSRSSTARRRWWGAADRGRPAGFGESGRSEREVRGPGRTIFLARSIKPRRGNNSATFRRAARGT
jgi:glycerol-3-phosphate cytidylyltransferase-like family protein